jgi:hypothetical protein
MKFWFFFIAAVAITCHVEATDDDCQPCTCVGVDHVNKTLITCGGYLTTQIVLAGKKIRFVNADAFENNTNMIEL